MSLTKFVNSGRKVFDKFYHSFSVYSSLTIIKPGAAHSRFFSSIFDSHRLLLESKKLILKPFTPLVSNFRGLKVKGELELRCKNCYFERKDGVMHVMCLTYPRHKQRAKTKKAKYTWILTHASQSKFRPY